VPCFHRSPSRLYAGYFAIGGRASDGVSIASYCEWKPCCTLAENASEARTDARVSVAGYWIYLCSLIGAYGLVALGLNFLTGYGGQISLGHAGFVAIGAYMSVILVDKLGAPFVVGLLAAVLVAWLVGLVVGFPTVRLKGLYLAVAILAFGLGVERVMYHFKDITGGPYGSPVSPPSLMGFRVDTDTKLYYLIVALVVLGVLFLGNILKRRPGRMIVAMRDSELAATAMGVDLTRLKVIAFAFSAAYSGLGGVLYAALLTFISVEHFTLWLSISFVAMIVVGGIGSIAGSFLGAAFVILVPELLRGVAEFQQIVYGLSMILIFVLWPGGLIGAVHRAMWALGRLRECMLGPRSARLEREMGNGRADKGQGPAESRTPPSVRRGPKLQARGAQQRAEARLPEAGSKVLAAGVRGEASGEAPRPREGQHPPAAMSREAQLSVENVSISFGGLQALNGVTLVVPRGAVVGLIGPNGSGKTTMLNLICRYHEPTRGRIVFEGRDLGSRRPFEMVGLGVARTFQNVQLFRSLTVLDNLLLGRCCRTRTGLLSAGLSLPRARREEREARRSVEELAVMLGITPELARIAGALPYGAQKLVELGRALAAEPRLLLLDEPVAGMNPGEKDALVEAITRVRSATGISLLLVDHDMSVVMDLCRYLYVLDFGKLIAEGTPSAVQDNALVIEAYLGTAKHELADH
jgi:branched-chain amino acid transport system permease protein